MKLYATDTFALPLPPGHRFPIDKYARLRQRLVESREFAPDDFRLPEAASNETLCRAHDRDYVQRVTDNRLTASELRAIGFPWSAAMVERSRRSVGATLAAGHAALADGVAASLAGGTHHAHADHGAGFCVFNDAAVTARALQAEGRVSRVLIVDLDVHQGDGTARILAGDDSIRTFSMHAAKNFPFRKAESDLDIELPDRCADAAYLERLDWGLALAFDLANPELVIYLAGADPYEDDRLGRLALSKAGLAERDRRVLAACRQLGVPLAIAMAGGYARRIEDSVDIHVATVLLAARFARPA